MEIAGAKPLGRPKKGEPYIVTAGERNPIEGKFGQAKTAYGLNRIKARLRQTSESWIATIVLVLNLVKLAKEASPCLLLKNLRSSIIDLATHYKSIVQTDSNCLFLIFSKNRKWKTVF